MHCRNLARRLRAGVGTCHRLVKLEIGSSVVDLSYNVTIWVLKTLNWWKLYSTMLIAAVSVYMY